MKKILLLCAVLCTGFSVFSQNPTITWGAQLDYDFHGAHPKVIAVDSSGIYVAESRIANIKIFKGTFSTKVSLIKVDHDLHQVYASSLDSAIGEKEFLQFYSIKDRLFIVAYSVSGGDTSNMSYYAAPIDKTTGKLGGEWKLLDQWQGPDIINYNADSSQLVLMHATVSDDKTLVYQVKRFDKNMTEIGGLVTLAGKFDQELTFLQDILSLSNGSYILANRVYQYEEGKKHKDKFLQFSNYDTRIYDSSGKQVKAINTDLSGKWVLSTQVVQNTKNELVLLSVYSEKRDDEKASGILVQRIDPSTGQILSTAKRVNTDGLPGISSYMRFRKVVYTSDGGLIIIAEEGHTYSELHSELRNSMMGVSRFDKIYASGNLMMLKVDASGTISWMHILPKEQDETFASGVMEAGDDVPFNLNVVDNYFTKSMVLDNYSSFGVIEDSTNVYILFNDEQKNKDVLGLEQKAKPIWNFWKNDLDYIKLNKLTGEYIRTTLFYNKDLPTAMPQFACIWGNDLFFTGELIGESFQTKVKPAVAKIHLSN